MKTISTVKIIVHNIQELRADRGWNKTRLAYEADLDPSYISRIEKGDRNVGLSSLDKIADAFGVKTYELLQCKEVKDSTLQNKLKRGLNLENKAQNC